MINWMRERMRVLASAGLAVVIAISVNLYVRHVERNAERPFKLTTVLKAKKFISPGAVLKEDDLEESKVPEAYLAPMALTRREDLKDEQGKWKYKSRLEIFKGEQISKSKLVEGDGGVGLAWVLPPDAVAFTLRLSPEEAVGGHVEPGDWVGVYVRGDPRDGWKDSAATLLISRVQVLAVNDRLIGEINSLKKNRDALKVSYTEQSFITLAVTPEQAARVMLAQGKGSVSLALYPVLVSSFPTDIKIKMVNLP